MREGTRIDRRAGAGRAVRERNRGRPIAGFSLVEVLIGAAVLLAIAIGIAPFFTTAMRSNLSGKEATEVSNFASSRLEELLQLPFGDPRFDLSNDTFGTNVCDGADDHKLFREYYSEEFEIWIDCEDPDDCPPADEDAYLVRDTFIRQFGIELNLATEDAEMVGPLTCSADPNSVSLKQIDVVLERPRVGGALGPGQEISVRVLKTL